LLFQAYALSNQYPWQTMIFTGLVLGRMAVVMAVRSENDSLLKIGFLSNKPLLGAVLLTFSLQMAIVYTPGLNSVFNTQPLTFNELLLTVVFASIVLFVVEFEKLYRRRKQRQAAAG
jgi:Ca2+-transporting ATPase